jgi:hypothetical protein
VASIPNKFLYQLLFYQIKIIGINIEANVVQSPNILCQLICLSIPTSDPTCRPTFPELLEKLKELQKQYVIQFQAARSAGGESTQRKES